MLKRVMQRMSKPGHLRDVQDARAVASEKSVVGTVLPPLLENRRMPDIWEALRRRE